MGAGLIELISSIVDITGNPIADIIISALGLIQKTGSFFI
jgi:hypothetical protein